MASWLVNYAPETGSTIAIDFGAGGSWTWKRESDRWAALEGVSETAAARVTFAPERVVRLFSRGLSYAEVVDSITIAGDDALAQGALAVMAPILSPPPD